MNHIFNLHTKESDQIIYQHSGLDHIVYKCSGCDLKLAVFDDGYAWNFISDECWLEKDCPYKSCEEIIIKKIIE